VFYNPVEAIVVEENLTTFLYLSGCILVAGLLSEIVFRRNRRKLTASELGDHHAKIEVFNFLHKTWMLFFFACIIVLAILQTANLFVITLVVSLRIVLEAYFEIAYEILPEITRSQNYFYAVKKKLGRIHLVKIVGWVQMMIALSVVTISAYYIL